MRQIEKSIGDACGLSIRKNVLEPGGDEATRRIRRHLDPELACSENLEPLCEGLRVEDERTIVVLPLIGRKLPGGAEGTPAAGCRTRGLR
jgi:hypothetical protein